MKINITCGYCALLLFFILLQTNLYAQIKPAEGSSLNYRIIGFKFPDERHASEYKIELASGSYTTDDSFNKHVIKTISTKNNKAIIEVPAFGTPYTWRYSYSIKSTVIGSQYNHFITMSAPQVDTSYLRFRVLEQAMEHHDHYVFLDGNAALYDMKGNPVWYLPKIENIGNIDNLVSDLKQSTQNTISYLLRQSPKRNDYNAYEINYDGKILWSAPDNGLVSGDDIEHYHHEFTHLDNNHYMVLGSEIDWKYPSPKDSIPFANLNNANNKLYPVEFGTVIEYDEKGKKYSHGNLQNIFCKKTHILLNLSSGTIQYLTMILLLQELRICNKMYI